MSICYLANFHIMLSFFSVLPLDLYRLKVLLSVSHALYEYYMVNVKHFKIQLEHCQLGMPSTKKNSIYSDIGPTSLTPLPLPSGSDKKL